MQELLTTLFIPFLTALGAAFITWLFARNRNTADTNSVQIDNEIKSADFYRGLLDDAMKRLNQAIDTINERDEKIKVLMQEIELITHELRKFKQLNGKNEAKG